MCAAVAKTPSLEAGSLVSSPPPIPNPKQIAFKSCVARIELALKQIRLGVPDGALKDLICPITQGFPNDPVVTNCGHLFGRAAIERWQNDGKPCALCQKPLSRLTRVHALREFVETRLPKDLVLSCDHFKEPDRQLADGCLALAQQFIKRENYGGALDIYRKALEYTNASADYAAVPRLYDQLNEKEKASFSRVYLSSYQLREAKIQEAIETLESCKTDVLNVRSLVTGLKLQLGASRENIESAMKEASDQKNPDDAVFIYKQILANAPDRLDAYERLIPLTKSLTERTGLLSKAAEVARSAQRPDLEAAFRNEAEMSRIPNAISTEEWAAARTIRLPPYPKELKDFLAGDCTVRPGYKREQTHIVVPLFPHVVMDDALSPSTLDALDKLDKSSGGPGCTFTWDGISKDIAAEKEFHYGVMTKQVVPGTISRWDHERSEALSKGGYEEPDAFDVVRALLWENRRSGKRYLSDIFTSCKPVQGRRLYVGAFQSSLLVGRDTIYPGTKLFGHDGVVGWRKFKV